MAETQVMKSKDEATVVRLRLCMCFSAGFGFRVRFKSTVGFGLRVPLIKGFGFSLDFSFVFAEIPSTKSFDGTCF